MTRLMKLLCLWLCAVAFIVAADPAHAITYPFTYVSNTGNDNNACNTPASACATFGGALTKTQNYGEIDCVNTGNYGGGLGIPQSVTIDCAAGVGSSYGGLIVSGTNIVVRLRNMTFNGNGYGTLAIDAKNMTALYIENCVITNYNPANSAVSPYLGIKFEPSAGEALLSVTNTVISANGNVGGGTGGGIEIAPASGATASVTLDGVKLIGNVYGIGLTSAGGTIVGALRHSTISGSNVSGLVAVGGGSAILWTVDDSSIMNNLSYGIQSLGSGVSLQISRSTITGNSTGVSGPGITSYKDNRISGNATDGTPIPAVPGASGTLF